MTKIRLKPVALALFSVLFLAGCSTSKLTHRTTQATLWVQNAAEFDALYLQGYRIAETYLQEALDTKTWTAALEQQGKDVSSLPPAIILDIDETILDNAPFQARMIEQNAEYTPEEWDKWVQEGNADALAGAVSLTQKAASMGIKVFYITNRDDKAKEATRVNLEREGFPVAKDTDTILLVGERENWTSAKTARRQMVADEYRILMLFGDDLNDFTFAKDQTQEQRSAIVYRYADFWGKKWFVFPNPIYGSWDQALINFDSSLSQKEKDAILETRLETRQKNN